MKENRPETRASLIDMLKGLIIGVRQQVSVEDMMADLEPLDKAQVDIQLHGIKGDQADIILVDSREHSRN